jgi:hypothetical protein
MCDAFSLFDTQCLVVIYVFLRVSVLASFSSQPMLCVRDMGQLTIGFGKIPFLLLCAYCIYVYVFCWPPFGLSERPSYLPGRRSGSGRFTYVVFRSPGCRVHTLCGGSG